MAITVRIVDNVAVWLAVAPVTLVDLKRAFVETSPVRDKFPGSARLVLLWRGDVPAAIRAEITDMHERTARVFERLVLQGPVTAQASLTARAAMARTPGPRIDMANTTEQALALASDGLPADTMSGLRALFAEIAASPDGAVSMRGTPSGSFGAVAPRRDTGKPPGRF